MADRVLIKNHSGFVQKIVPKEPSSFIELNQMGAASPSSP